MTEAEQQARQGKPLAVGLLVDDACALQHVRELVLWAQAQPDIDISHLLVYGTPRAAPGGHAPAFARLAHALSARCMHTLMRVENILLRQSGTYRAHLSHHDLSAAVPGRIDLEAPRVQADGGHAFDAAAVARVREQQLDVLLCCGPGLPTGDMLDAARLGVLRMHFGDSASEQAGPAGFWECFHRLPSTAFAIQRLSGARSDEVLVRGRFATRISFLQNQAHLYRKANVHLQGLLQSIAAQRRMPASQPRRLAGPPPGRQHLPLGGPPGTVHILRYAMRTLGRAAVKGAQRALSLRRKFGISIVQSDWRHADLRQAVEVASPKGRFWADPFLWKAPDGRLFCFVEDYVYARRRAHISVLEVIGTKVMDLGAVIAEPFHLSFPYLFAYQGDLYMCPECSDSEQIRIYRCTGFPQQWELAAVAMDGVSAADTILFERGGRWWMLTSIDKSGVKDHCSELYLFSNDSPLRQGWKPFGGGNPVLIDSAGGRNAGLIAEGDRLFRLAQRQGFDRYGEGLIVNEILTISELAYEERQVSRIDPTFRKRLLGSHHLTTTGNITVIDHVSRQFVI
ncbi:hypothetical protein P3W85_42140 [Cupriavidus basilensis]|uniref:Glucosamine inositolphosphorylceramide transferase 1 N-terminal domain-containing protein n=1 Tax=Cupriavidus basilensis TaxID=68895 RepID=A0ABT6B3W5_9BURK|nr:hypothetical protein [Cupriavidus basilensis]MDF3839493.1 hypothetical protein [Cupriavidus basilensis]